MQDVRTKCLSLANMLMMSDMVDFQVKVKSAKAGETRMRSKAEKKRIGALHLAKIEDVLAHSFLTLFSSFLLFYNPCIRLSGGLPGNNPSTHCGC